MDAEGADNETIRQKIGRIREQGGRDAQFYAHEVFTEDEINESEELSTVLSKRPVRGLQAPRSRDEKTGNSSDLYRSLIKNAMNVKDDSQPFNQGELKEVKSKNPKLQIFRKKRDTSNDTRFMDWVNSASVVAERHVKFRPFESILIEGDALGKVFTDAELKARGADEGIITAYKSIRRLYDHAHSAVSKQWEKYGKEKLNYRQGYVPHFFHSWRVTRDGEILTSFRTMNEAVKAAEDMLKDSPNDSLKIVPAGGTTILLGSLSPIL